MSKQFKLFCLDTGQDYLVNWGENEGEILVYDNGKEAEHDAKTLTLTEGIKWQVRPHIVDNSWQEREAKRFYDGIYYPVPWETQGWWRGSKADKYHFAHISVETDVRIAYTSNASMGVADRQTRIKPGRYLEKYFSNHLRDEDIRHWVAEFSIQHEDIQLKYAKTAEEIEHVYRNGPNSCMANKPEGTFQSGVHPVTVYAGPDLAIAYLEKDKSEIGKRSCRHCSDTEDGCPNVRKCEASGNGQCTLFSARCLVWPERKLHSKIYGDIDRLKLALQRDGFKKGDLSGAKLTRKPVQVKHRETGKLHDGFISPYIDDFRGLKDDGNHLVISQEGYLVADQFGVAFDNRAKCAWCGNMTDPRSFRLVLNSNASGHEHVCGGCLSKTPTFECSHTGHICKASDVINLGLSDGGTRAVVHKRYIESQIAVCPETHVWLWITDGYDAVRLADNRLVHRKWVQETKLSRCNGCDKHTPNGDFTCQQRSACYSQPNWWYNPENGQIYSQLDKNNPAGSYVSYEAAKDLRRNDYEAFCQRREAARLEQIAENRRQAQRLRRERERAEREGART